MRLDEHARRAAAELQEAGRRAQFTVVPPGTRSPRWWPIAAVAATIVLAVGTPLAWRLASTDDGFADSPTTTRSVTSTSSTVVATSTVAAVKTPAGSVDELVTALYAALNSDDDAALRSLSTDEARHAVYWAGAALQGIQTDFAIATYRLATSGIDRIELLGEPIVSGNTITIPVRYFYVAEGPYLGFDVLVTEAVDGGLLISGGATLFADENLAVDPAGVTVIEAEHAAWNANDADGVVANFATNGTFWETMPDPEATHTGDDLRSFVTDSLWFEVEITADPTTSGPFIAVPNRLVAATDESEGISIYLIRDGKITLHSFAQ